MNINDMSTDVLNRIITNVLNNNIKAIRLLALNKRIHAAADALWPDIARIRLKYKLHTSINYPILRTVHDLDTKDGTDADAMCSLLLSMVRKDQYTQFDIVFTAPSRKHKLTKADDLVFELSVRSDIVTIRTSSHIATFKAKGQAYIFSSYSPILRDGTRLREVMSYAVPRDTCSKNIQLITRVLPELRQLFRMT